MATALKTDKRAYAFDWGGTLESNESVRQMARSLFAAGHDIYIVPAVGAGSPCDNDEFYKAALRGASVPWSGIRRVSHPPYGDVNKWVAEEKVNVLRELNAAFFWDDNRNNEEAARAAGFKCALVTPEYVASLETFDGCSIEK